MPWTYRHASQEWRALLDDVKERANLSSDNMAYTAIEGVFRTFRRRLSAEQAIAFAQVLPAVPRAVFVQDWNVAAPAVPFTDRATMTREAQSLRKDHNLTPDNAIEAVALALWRQVDHRAFKRCIEALPEGAVAFWNVDCNPKELEQRFP